MPYKSFKRGSKYKVYKIDADGNPTGDALGTHDSREKALAQIRAIEANTQESKSNVRTSDLHESVDLSEAQLDHEQRIAKNATIIKSGWSLNNKYYSDDMLSKKSNIWEGVRAYVDHPSKDEMKQRPERSIRDVLGIWENVHHENRVTRGDFRLIGNEWAWPLIVETVESGKPIIGASINALGQTVIGEAEGKKGILVEDITHANSVDIVTAAGAGGGFENAVLMQSDDGWTKAVLESLSIDELKEARPDVIESLKNEWKTPRDNDALVEEKTRADRAEAKAAALEKEKRTLEAQLSRVREQRALLQKERMVDSLLEGATLPGEWLEDLRAELMESNPDEWGKIIEAEKRKAKAIKPKTRVTGAGRPAEPEQARLRAANQNTPVRFNIDESAPQPGESFTAWKRRTNKE